MKRIQNKLHELRGSGRKALIPYVTPEFPFRGITLQLLRRLEEGGADMIEVGIPFSDPLADGPTIQHSSEVALANGASIPGIMAAVREFRTKSELPLLLMGYVNPILHFGMEQFMSDCREAGVDGLIIPDLPPEESGELKSFADRREISTVFLIAPTTPDERIRQIDDLSTDFSYCVSVTGVTGARQKLGDGGSIDEFLRRVRRNAKKPFVVGFGISSAEHVARVWQHADGAVVGSALIRLLDQAATAEEATASAREFVRSLRPDEDQ